MSVVFNAILRLEYPPGGPSTMGAGFTLHGEKLRARRDETTRAPLVMTLRETGWVAEVDEDTRMAQAVTALSSLRYTSYRELEEGTGIPRTSLQRLLIRAETTGLLHPQQAKKYWIKAKDLRKAAELGTEFDDLSDGMADDDDPDF